MSPKFILLFFVVGICFSSFSQTGNNKYLIRFTDKANTPYAISNPSVYLSQRAIDRRNNQHISIKVNDLPVNPNYIDSVSAKGAVLLYATKWLNGVVVRIDDTTNATLNKINQLPFVVNANSVGKRISKNKSVPRDNSFFKNENHVETPPPSNQRSNGTYDYGLALNQIHMLNGEQLHDKGYRGDGMVIAVLDAGFHNADVLPAFDSLWANHQILGFKDFVQFNDSGVFQDDAHGMEVLSTMGGNIPGQLIGTAPKASFWLLRSENAPSEYIIEEVNYVRAAEFADSVGADIIHSSLGYTTFDDPSEDHQYKDMNGNTAYCTIGADIAASKGILVTCSAGNEGGSSWHYISAPADGDSVLAVGATYNDGTVTFFSSYGPSFDGRVKPNVMAQGAGAAIENTDGFVKNNGNGTSFSGPILAGMSASLWSSLKNLNNMQLFSYIQKSASLYQTPNDSMGYGIPDFAKAYFYATGKLLSTGKAPNNGANIIVVNRSINEGVKFLIISDSVQNADIDLYDLTGKKAHSSRTSLQQGFNEISISDSPIFNVGMYIMQLSLPQKQAQYTYKTIKY